MTRYLCPECEADLTTETLHIWMRTEDKGYIYPNGEIDWADLVIDLGIDVECPICDSVIYHSEMTYNTDLLTDVREKMIKIECD